MKKIEVIGLGVTLHFGVVKLSKEQAKARAYALKHIKGDEYAIEKPVSFKRGEVFSYDGEINKTLASLIDDKGKKSKAEVQLIDQNSNELPLAE